MAESNLDIKKVAIQDLSLTLREALVGCLIYEFPTLEIRFDESFNEI